MTALGEFIVPYLGLANGVHSYTFHIDKDFFRHFETSRLRSGQLDLKVDLDKLDRMVTLLIKCTGSYSAPCDRCTANIDIPMEYNDQIIIKLEEVQQSIEEEVVYLNPKSSEIDLAPILYESMHLHLPMLDVKDCEAESYMDCDHEVLDKLESSENEEDDVRFNVWSELDKLKLN